jgi:septal ring-binding cell division protein DamX
MSNGSTPISHKKRDGNWVESQNPNGYNVQADEQNGQNSYKGVYGTYQNKESATKAIEQLPAGLKSKVKVKQGGGS